MIARTRLKVTLHLHSLSCCYSVTNVKCMVFNEHGFGIVKKSRFSRTLKNENAIGVMIPSWQWVGEQDTGSPGRLVSSGLQVPGEPGHCRARTRPPW